MDTGGRIRAWVHALPTWALANPEEFRLVYGDAVPGYQPPARCRAAGRTALLYRPACPGRRLAVCRAPAPRQRLPVGRFRPRTPRPGSSGLPFPDLPPAVAALTLRIWGHLHGLISLEVHGHLHARTTRLDKLYDDVTQLLRSLNLERHPAASGGPDGR
ncbi:TetR-like C-terminal domain-containing protein [Streptomyces niveus]|uniref:TetR-like C-terminal domain-containing protein n=1 Tax=Streptomyces niveus TaxID=193462 RepID=UPI0035DA076C